MTFSTHVEMTDYDQVKDKGCISFISEKGNPLSVWIHRPTFRSLMVGPWDAVKLGDPTLQQKELKKALLAKVKTEYMKWFEENANNLQRRKTIGDK